MKKSAFLLGLMVVGAAHAQTFSTVQFLNTAGATATFSTTGNAYRATLTGFNIAANSAEDVAWTYNFNSNPVPAYTAVTIRIAGTLSNGSLEILGNEKVFDMAGSSPVEVVNGTISGSWNQPVGTASFVLSQTFTFSSPVTMGQAQKDILSITTNGGVANISYIEQEYTPVPEPATIAALGLGAAALMRRRKKA
jgi:hypothetical protein